jgi:polygalacturonase
VSLPYAPLLRQQRPVAPRVQQQAGPELPGGSVRLSRRCGAEVALAQGRYMTQPTKLRKIARSRSIYTSVALLAVLVILIPWVARKAPGNTLAAGSGNLPPAGLEHLPSAGFSNDRCAEAGASATRIFRPAGAVANGTADDYSAIQSAIDTASSSGGGVVRLGAGTYLVDGHLVMKSNVRLTGAGPATIIKAGPGFLSSTGPDGGYPLITTAGASNVTVSNLTADQSGNVLNGNASPGARFSAFLIDLRNSHNVLASGVDTRNPFTYSIAVVGSSDFCVIHCHTEVTSTGRYNGLDGIHVLDSHTGQVIQNHVDQRIGQDGDDGLVAHTISAPVYDVLYAGNVVRGGNYGDGMQLAVGNYPIYDLTIRDNDFYGSPFGIRTGYYATGAGGAVRQVEITGNDIHNLIPGAAFPHGGNAVDIGGFGAIAPVSSIAVIKNVICHAGVITVVPGHGNVVTDNLNCPR